MRDDVHLACEVEDVVVPGSIVSPSIGTNRLETTGLGGVAPIGTTRATRITSAYRRLLHSLPSCVVVDAFLDQ